MFADCFCAPSRQGQWGSGQNFAYLLGSPAADAIFREQLFQTFFRQFSGFLRGGRQLEQGPKPKLHRASGKTAAGSESNAVAIWREGLPPRVGRWEKSLPSARVY